MKNSLSLLLGLLVALSLCVQRSVLATDKRPRDFSIEYHWRSGSVPPPHHFQYSIIINPVGQGEVVMIPDYPSETVPRWTETFTVEGKELDKLYRVMVDNGLFTRRWKALERQPIGGSRQSMTVTAGGKRIVIEGRMASDEEALADTMFSALTSMVPKAIWDKLNSQREEYMRKHSRR